jgi:endonuclease YncB( thermonuclease family)
MRRILSIALLALLCLSLRTHASTLQVRVVEIQDGKTIIVENTGRRMKVILKAADAPEMDQPVGSLARQHLSDLILGKQVAVELAGMDYGSRYFIARVFSGEVDISLQMIRDGVAWYDRQYEKEMSDVERQLYRESEEAARLERRGIWQDPRPVPPWEWRQQASKSAQKTSQPVTTPVSATKRATPIIREDAGWPMFSPSGAPFSVRMPGGGKHFSSSVTLPEGQTISLNFYGVNHLKIGYIALWASGPAGDATLDTLFNQMQEILNQGSATRGLSCEFTRKKDVSFNGYIGRRYVVQGCYYHGGIRLYYKMEGKTLKACMVGVLGEDANDPSINQFLESFVINEGAKK